MSVTLEDIEQLSIEVTALVNAGLPLEGHLAEAGTGHSRRLQQLTESISASLQDGRSLEETIRNDRIGAPRILAAAVAAGIRTGKLSDCIEMLGDMAHDIVDLRRRVLQSITYPLTVIAVALVLFVLFIRTFLARVNTLFHDPDSSPSEWFLQLTRLDAEFWWWPLVFPLVGLVCFVLWVVSGRADSLTFRGPERLIFLLPGVRGLVRDLHFYNLSRLLSQMVDREIPLPDALILAGACSGSAGLDQACQSMSKRIQEGRMSAVGRDEDWRPGAMPPMLMTCLRQTGNHEAQFRQRLGSVSGYYRRRLDVSLAWLRNIVPVAMFVVVGGGTVLLYGLLVFLPVIEIYRNVLPN